MVNYATYKYEKPSYLDMLADPALAQLTRAGREPMILTQKFLYATPAADTEIRTSFTNELDGVATPVVIDIKSSDNTKDIAAGDGAQTVAILGISGSSETATDFKIQEEIITLTGTTAVETTLFYKRIMGTRTVTAGSEKDPAGNITVHEANGTSSTYCTQTAAYNYSINSRIYCPDGYNMHLHSLVTRRIPTTNTATASLTDGGILTIKRDGSLLTQYSTQKIGIIPLHNTIQHVDCEIEGSDDNYYTLSLQAVDQDVTTVYCYIRVSYIIYKASGI